MSISLNSPISHVVKITSQIRVYLEIEDRFKVFFHWFTLILCEYTKPWYVFVFRVPPHPTHTQKKQICFFIIRLKKYLRKKSNLVDRNWSRKKWGFWQKLAKRTVSIPNWFHFFIFISHSFTWKLTNKNDSFVTIFWKKCCNFGQVSWNCDIG